jgi:hypothetical protein
LEEALFPAGKAKEEGKGVILCVKLLRYLTIFFAVFALVGCGPSSNTPKEDVNPAPSSSVTKEQAKALGFWWVIGDPNNRITGDVTPTASMIPYVDSRSILFLEKYTGQKLYVGDIVMFDRGDAKNVLHRIKDIKDGHVYMSGDNNMYPDGWFPLSAIKYRLAGQIYTQR